MTIVRTPWIAVLLALALPGAQEEMPLLLHEDFEKGADRWEPLDPKAWKVADGPSGRMYSQFQKGSYKPPHRSPENFSLLKDVAAGDFVLEARCQSTVKDYGHRDMVVVFGHQDPARFYYVHLGKKADDHANQIFIVNGAPRTKISTKTTPGTDWTDGWHAVKVVRKADAGMIEVYFDDMKAPAMTATDRTFAWGRVGVGTFDDTGNWDDIRLRGVRVERPGR